jgi:hypothetical protein
MSISKIFWIDEQPIRELISSEYPQIIEKASLSQISKPVSSHGPNLRICKIVGQHFWDSIPHFNKMIDNISISGNRTEDNEIISKCFNFDDLDYETNNIWFFMWNKNKMQRLCYGYKDNVFSFYDAINEDLLFTTDTLLKLKSMQTGMIYNGLSNGDKKRIVSKQLVWNNQFALRGSYSVYWFYLNTFIRQDKSPSFLSVGETLLNFIYSDWNHSIDCFNRVSTIGDSNVISFFIWKGNCLRNIIEFDDDEIKELELLLNGLRKK